MGIRVRVRIERLTARSKAALEVVALANSAFESDAPEVLVPTRVAEHLELWPPPPGARRDVFESPAATFRMITVPQAVRVRLSRFPRRTVRADVTISERETEVVLNDALVEALRLVLVAPKRGLYRIGTGSKLHQSDEPEHW